ncbi:2Fe-2S iron-sulfur cluster-binding protein [Streptomyces syringium]|uniref:Aerobic-type carbon monoxide dehydrogenase small subunit (CoxS/CutS family) n=1 Tax=Streptomyces syringium TaxID=76729 RepID=A0ABS4Y317_9ACTN|nr:2Fe-2S iron-sulfur cluster-binding protein [Streptomyces syringium]MBP2403129.1 aerobic-type carbon monoxide dehydrogenase small subunit (CoxS/CutS family) [Streptomyces syringium]
MSDEQQRHASPTGESGWQPIPRGAELDAEGTTFVQLPPELLAHPGAATQGGSWDPLAAPGAGGYTPPPVASWQQSAPPSQPAPAQEPAHGTPAHTPLHTMPAQAQAPDQWATPHASAHAADHAVSHAVNHAAQHAAGQVANPAVSYAGDPAAQHAAQEPVPLAAAGAGAMSAQDAVPGPVPGSASGVPGVPGASDWPVPAGSYDYAQVQQQGHAPIHEQSHGQPSRNQQSHGQPSHGQSQDYGHVPAGDGGGGDPHDTAQWPMPFAPGESGGHAGAGEPAHAAHQQGGSTGQWTVPAAGDDPVDESGEYALGNAADPHNTAQWPVPHAEPDEAVSADAWHQPMAAMGAETGSTGQWSIPAAQDDTADESGEYALGGFAGGFPAPVTSSFPAPGADGHGSFTAPQHETHDTQVTGTGDHQAAPWTQPATGADGSHAGHPHAEEPAVPETPAAPEGGDGHEQAPAVDAVPDAGQPEQFAAAAPEHAPVESQAEPQSPPVSEVASEPESSEYPQVAADLHPVGREADEAPAPEAGPQAEDLHTEGLHTEGLRTEGLRTEELRTDGPGPDVPQPEADQAPAPPVDNPHTEHPHASYVLRVNGTDRPVTDAWIGESLLYVLRERLGLAGAKDGCSQGECGACSVQVDGRLVASCLVPAATAAGAEVRTVEGLAVDGQPSDVQRALAACGAVQCGFCVPGMAMTMHDLLEGNHAPTELETRQALCGNLCRCSGYRGVLDAVRQVADERAESAAAQEAANEAVHEAADGTAHETAYETAHETAYGAGPGDGAGFGQEQAWPGADSARIPHQAGPHDGGSGRATA